MSRTFSFGMPSVVARSPRPQSIIWLEVHSRQLVAVPSGDGGERLHHHVALVGRGVMLVELDRRRGERLLEVADAVDWTASRDPSLLVPPVSGAVFSASARSNWPGARAYVDADQRGGGARLLERLGDHHRDRLMVMIDLGPGRAASPC